MDVHLFTMETPATTIKGNVIILVKSFSRFISQKKRLKWDQSYSYIPCWGLQLLKHRFESKIVIVM